MSKNTKPIITTLYSELSEPMQPAVAAGYHIDISAGTGAICVSLTHDSLPHIVVWGTEEAEITIGSRGVKFEGPGAIRDAVAAALKTAKTAA